jgi:hypothetical protein
MYIVRNKEFEMFAYARKTVQVDATQKVAVDALAAVVAKLGQRDQEFAGSLISGFNRFGRLSDKQMPWVDTLTQRATAPKPTPVVTEKLNFQPIQDLFDKAAQKLKRVKIKLQAPNGQAVTFNRAGAMSKYAGQVMVTDGQPFGQNKFFGRIDVNGDFFATRVADAPVMELVKEFANDPAGTAGRYGRLTGGCSFCNHPLKDERSTEVGYGPVCAKNFGLAWG